MRRFLLPAIFVGFAFVSCGGPSFSGSDGKEIQIQTPQAQKPKEEKKEKDLYPIQPGDILVIDVWRVPLLSQEVTVGVDGTFLYPLLGSVKAEEKTVDQIRSYLTEALGKDYLMDPVVTVARRSKSQGFFVVGEVRNPGAFQFEERINVYQAIIMAGGFTDFASKRAKIIRRSSGHRKVIKINIKHLEKEGPTNPDAQIQPGDTVVVPKRWL